MRFDDSLSTVLAADTSSAFGAQSAFRQIVDLLGRGRIAASAELVARLEALRLQVPLSVRAAVARGLALATPPVSLISFFAEDEPSVAAAALRAATLDEQDWDVLLPRIGPTGRAVLRARTDLPAATRRGLEAFGATDFALSFEGVSQPRPEPATALFPDPAAPSPPPAHGFPISELVDRIAAFQRGEAPEPPSAPPPEAFAFETDSRGRICWTDVEPRASLIGLNLGQDLRAAIRARQIARAVPFTLATVSPFGGRWHADADPVFDAEGRFLGLHGNARREIIVPTGNGEAIRRLVHELRTPMNAISGFAELMESELLGPVAPMHRTAAGAIHGEMADLLGAIEDLDVAARIDDRSLELAPSEVALWPLLERHGPHVALHGARDAIVLADPRALHRLLDRLMVLLSPGARIDVAYDGFWTTLRIDPSDRSPDAAVRSPLLGTQFTMRLVGDLARELGGLLVEDEQLTLRLPGGAHPQVQIGGSR